MNNGLEVIYDSAISLDNGKLNALIVIMFISKWRWKMRNKTMEIK